MNLVKVISICIIGLLIGCSKVEPTILTKTEYKEVYVPMKITIEKPNRPAYDKKDTIHTYLLKLIEYTKELEGIINEYSK